MNKSNISRSILYQKILNGFISEANSGLLSVVNVGSLVRGTDDFNSDYDFILIWDDLMNNIWPEGACRIEDFKCGIRNVTYNSLKQKEWSQLERHSYEHSKIEYDPKSIMSKLIEEKCI